MNPEDIARMITEDPDMIAEAKCPGCGLDHPDVYLGFNKVECPNPTCRLFSGVSSTSKRSLKFYAGPDEAQWGIKDNTIVGLEEAIDLIAEADNEGDIINFIVWDDNLKGMVKTPDWQNPKVFREGPASHIAVLEFEGGELTVVQEVDLPDGSIHGGFKLKQVEKAASDYNNAYGQAGGLNGNAIRALVTVFTLALQV